MTQPAFLDDYLHCFDHTWDVDGSVEHVRFVLLDSETTGLDPRKDRLVTIGAVAVKNNEIVLDDSFEALLKVAYNSGAVTVHGVTRDESLQGLDEPAALQQFLAYLKDGVIVGHHIGHDVHMLNAGYQRHFGFSLRNLSLDTMDLTLHLEQDGAFAQREQIRSFTLDSLCSLFDVVPHDRHTAAGDAFLTAQVFQRLLRLAVRNNRLTLASISQPFESVVKNRDVEK